MTDQLGSPAKRLYAYFIDLLPISTAVFCFYYFFMGFDEITFQHMNNPMTEAYKKPFQEMEAQIRNISLILWVLYGLVMDASPLQGTLGKHWMGLKVTDDDGNRISLGRSAIRNGLKIISIMALFLGVLWIFFNPERKAWHDGMAKTLLLKRDKEKV